MKSVIDLCTIELVICRQYSFALCIGDMVIKPTCDNPMRIANLLKGNMHVLTSQHTMSFGDRVRTIPQSHNAHKSELYSTYVCNIIGARFFETSL